MNWTSTARITKLGLVNFWRNRWLSLASTMVMTLTLLIISFFVVATILVNKTTQDIKDKIDMTVYIIDAAKTEEITELQNLLAARPEVQEIKYISKEEALKIWQEKQNNRRIRELVSAEENPLPRSLAIKTDDPEKLQAVADFVANSEFKSIIHKISYEENKQLIDKMIAITGFVQKIGWVISGIFIIISILVILNTVRLAIFNRKDEIEIMRLVGASDSFIKVPFVIEGTLYGIIACFLAVFVAWLGIISISPLIAQHLGQGVVESMRTFFWGNFSNIFLLQLLVGVVVGVLCSLFSIRKHLKV